METKSWIVLKPSFLTFYFASESIIVFINKILSPPQQSGSYGKSEAIFLYFFFQNAAAVSRCPQNPHDFYRMIALKVTVQSALTTRKMAPS